MEMHAFIKLKELKDVTIVVNPSGEMHFITADMDTGQYNAAVVTGVWVEDRIPYQEFEDSGLEIDNEIISHAFCFTANHPANV